MLTKARLFHITKVSEEQFDYAIRTDLIPAPERMVWLNPPPQKDVFPDYVMATLIDLGRLEASGLSTPWELRKYLLGAEGTVMYESDLKRRCGDLFYEEIDSHKRCELQNTLCQRVAEFFPGQRIAATAFREEEVDRRLFLILSRAILKPRIEPLQVELTPEESKNHEDRLMEAYRIITKGAPL